jgi:hypothetical protein
MVSPLDWFTHIGIWAPCQGVMSHGRRLSSGRFRILPGGSLIFSWFHATVAYLVEAGGFLTAGQIFRKREEDHGAIAQTC